MPAVVVMSAALSAYAGSIPHRPRTQSNLSFAGFAEVQAADLELNPEDDLSGFFIFDRVSEASLHRLRSGCGCVRGFHCWNFAVIADSYGGEIKVPAAAANLLAATPVLCKWAATFAIFSAAPFRRITMPEA